VVSTSEVRSLTAIAEENAVEGCVRETFGALLATFQATHAADTSVRAAMRRIARDETRHAVLGWRIASWVEGRVDRGCRARVAAARRDALGDMLAGLGEPSADMVHTLGLPTRTQSLALAHKLQPLISRTV
jgi:hypothetical protein